jgi:two-component system chemotaxis response regulator CheY
MKWNQIETQWQRVSDHLKSMYADFYRALNKKSSTRSVSKTTALTRGADDQSTLSFTTISPLLIGTGSEQSGSEISDRNTTRSRLGRASDLPSSPPHTSPRRSILVVDDDEDMRVAIELVLSPKYRVTLAIDGLDGYVKANEEPGPDLIIADVSMPFVDGITMVRRIRENDALRGVPVIFLTGQTSRARLVEGLSVGAFAYLTKPTDPETLEKNVKSALLH